MEQNARVHVIPLSLLVDTPCLICGKAIRRSPAVVAICTADGIHWAGLCARHDAARCLDEIEETISVPAL